MLRRTGQDFIAEYRLTGDFLAGRLRHVLSEDDKRYIESLVDRTRSLEDGEHLVRRGELTDECAILLEGFMFRTIESAQGRSIVGVNVPGDFVDLHGFALKRLDHDVVAAGKARLGIVPHRRLARMMEEQPGIARAMWFATLLDAAIHRKWIEMLERLDAPRQVAHHYLELHTRLGFVGLANSYAIRPPFTQIDLADMCGISAVHANRAVSKLRDANLAEIRRGTLYPKDWKALREYAQFEPDYLYGDGTLHHIEAWG